jgi:hypothetical protein
MLAAPRIVQPPDRNRLGGRRDQVRPRRIDLDFGEPPVLVHFAKIRKLEAVENIATGSQRIGPLPKHTHLAAIIDDGIFSIEARDQPIEIILALLAPLLGVFFRLGEVDDISPCTVAARPIGRRRGLVFDVVGV